MISILDPALKRTADAFRGPVETRAKISGTFILPMNTPAGQAVEIDLDTVPMGYQWELEVFTGRLIPGSIGFGNWALAYDGRVVYSLGQFGAAGALGNNAHTDYQRDVHASPGTRVSLNVFATFSPPSDDPVELYLQFLVTPKHGNHGYHG